MPRTELQLRQARPMLRSALAGFSLCAAFTLSAAPIPDERLKPHENKAKPVSLSDALRFTPQQAKDRQVAVLFHRIENALQSAQKDYSRSTSEMAKAVQLAHEIFAKLGQGANPNASLSTFMDSGNCTLLQAMIIVANTVHRPELVNKMIVAGANILTSAPDGWTVMDYALEVFFDAQKKSRRHAQNALKVVELLEQRGLSLEDGIRSPVIQKWWNIKDSKDILVNPLGAHVLFEAGRLTQQEYEKALGLPVDLAEKISSMTPLTPQWIKDNGGKLRSFLDLMPDGIEEYQAKEGETVDKIAEKFFFALGMNNPEILAAVLSTKNSIDRNTPLKKDQVILIPLPSDRQLVQIGAKNGDSLLSLATEFLRSHPNERITALDFATDLARMNDIDPAKIDDKNLSMHKKAIWSVAFRDQFTQNKKITRHTAAIPDSPSHLIVIESGKLGDHVAHHKKTFGTAIGTGFSINPDANTARFIAWDENLPEIPGDSASNALNLLLRHSPMTIFSYSAGMNLDSAVDFPARNSQSGDHATLENMRLYQPILEESKPIVFSAAGNGFPESGRFAKNAALSNSPRYISVGAVGQYTSMAGATILAISPYTTNGGDLCHRLPLEGRKQIEGTSVSAPGLAAYYRQFAEWYGAALSFEEIMAASMLTADRDILHFPKTKHLTSEELNQPIESESEQAPFRINGAGVPINEQCGYGVVNPQKWHDAIGLMIDFKKAAAQEARSISHTLPLPTAQARKSKDQYIYQFKVPEDMTLGRLTFFMPQESGAHSDITVKTPAGYGSILPYTLTDAYSTFEFAYEDVKAGDIIEISTEKPLVGTAQIILRGQAPGNIIQKLRDKLMKDGALPSTAQSPAPQ